MAENGRTALVTGASSGIGKETAIRLAKNGYKVIAAARRIDRLRELADQIEGIVPRQVDLSKPDQVEEFFRFIKDLEEPVSVLINNAGYSIRGALEDVDADAYRRIFEVNLFSLIRVTQACLPGMRKRREGTIVNLSSIVGKYTFPVSGIYSATKHAVEALSDSLRMELRPFGIRVVTIRPGPIATEFNEVANELTGDLMGRTDPDYREVYQAAGAGVGKMFAGLSIPGPELIADIITEAVLSESPRPVYAAGPFVDEILEQRLKMNDEKFDNFLTEKVGLAKLKL